MESNISRWRKSLPWRKFAIIFVCVIGVLLIYGYKIHTLPPSSNFIEKANYIGVDTLDVISTNIVFGPQKILDYVGFYFANLEVAYFRIISSIIVFIAVTIFYLLIKQWFSTRVALMSVLLFVCSTWVIFDGRFGGFDSMLLLALPVLLLAGSMLKIKEFDSLLPLTTFLVALTLYIPLFWIFLLIGSIIVSRDLSEAWKESSNLRRVFWVSAFVLPLIPLVYSLILDNGLKAWLSLPESRLTAGLFVDNIANLPNQLFLNGIPSVTEWLPGTPILDVVTTAFFVFGFYYIVRDKKFPIRRGVLIGSFLLSIILISIMGYTYISLILPLLYIFAAFGIAFLLEQWFHIFPKNPVARSFGVVAITVLVVMACSYNVLRYHYVWPRAHNTAQILKNN